MPLSAAAAAWPILKAISSRVVIFIVGFYASKADWSPPYMLSVVIYGWKITGMDWTGMKKQPESGTTVFV